MMSLCLNVILGERSYPISIGAGQLHNIAKIFKKCGIAGPMVILTDRNVEPLYGSFVAAKLQKIHKQTLLISIPSGEREKNIRRAEEICGRMLRSGFGRDSTLVALGGGVVGDLGGFVASVYMRGIRFVQIPTTLLAQVDSSVGGKTGINHPLGKNMIGTFYQPSLVIADIETLRTLPQREFISGLGEVVKYGVILDQRLFSIVEKNLSGLLSCDEAMLEKIIYTCCSLKAKIVSADEREKGIRMILNFGHTIGHALEHAGGYNTLKHGEAILYGMAAESFIAQSKGILSPKERSRITDIIAAIKLPKLTRRMLNPSLLLKSMKRDKKNRAEEISFVLPMKIGTMKGRETADAQTISDALRQLSKIQ